MGKTVFVTGTDTDVGKTYVSALLAKKMNADYYKPVLSGAEWVNGELIAMDAKFVLDECGRKEVHPNACVSYFFEEACSPHLASRRANLPIEFEKIQKDYHTAKENSSYLVVEGAGGLICPLKEDELMLVDMVKKLTLPIVIVSDSGVGAINRVMLTVHYARAKALEIAGIVMNRFESGNWICEENLSMIQRLSGVKVIETVSTEQNELQVSAEELSEIFGYG